MNTIMFADQQRTIFLFYAKFLEDDKRYVEIGRWSSCLKYFNRQYWTIIGKKNGSSFVEQNIHWRISWKLTDDSIMC
jgi:hypothetical protein